MERELDAALSRKGREVHEEALFITYAAGGRRRLTYRLDVALQAPLDGIRAELRHGGLEVDPTPVSLPR